MKCGYFPKIIMEIFMFTISSFQSGITITYMYTEDNDDCEGGKGWGRGRGMQSRLIITSSHYNLPNHMELG